MFFSKKKKNRIVGAKRKFDPKKEERNARPLFARISFYFLLAAFVAVTAYALLFSLFLEIKTVEIEGNETLETQVIARKINGMVAGKYFGIIPKNNYLFLTEEKIKRMLEDEFKKIKSVEISRTFPDRLKITVTERKALIVWCSGETCHIIDEQGFAYTPVSLDSPEVLENNLIKVEDSGARAIEAGKQVVTGEYAAYLTELREKISRNLEIRNEWKTPSPMAQEIEVPAGEGWRLIFSSKISPEKSLRTLETFLSQEVGEEKRKDLEYVDLRVENKVFYKLKNEEEKEEEKKNESEEEEQSS